jgi:hypothetical protein
MLLGLRRRRLSTRDGDGLGWRMRCVSRGRCLLSVIHVWLSLVLLRRQRRLLLLLLLMLMLLLWRLLRLLRRRVRVLVALRRHHVGRALRGVVDRRRGHVCDARMGALLVDHVGTHAAAIVPGPGTRQDRWLRSMTALRGVVVRLVLEMATIGHWGRG